MKSDNFVHAVSNFMTNSCLEFVDCTCMVAGGRVVSLKLSEEAARNLDRLGGGGHLHAGAAQDARDKKTNTNGQSHEQRASVQTSRNNGHGTPNQASHVHRRDSLGDATETREERRSTPMNIVISSESVKRNSLKLGVPGPSDEQVSVAIHQALSKSCEQYRPEDAPLAKPAW